MFENSLLIIGGLCILFITLILEVIHIEQNEDLFIDRLNWKGQSILLGDTILIQTSHEAYEGYFRGIIAGKDKWIFRFSSEGKPKIEFNRYDIIDIKKLAKNQKY
ncbi:MAG: hypothetical protein ACOWWO_03275 [Peptococcaceae bacterium]